MVCLEKKLPRIREFPWNHTKNGNRFPKVNFQRKVFRIFLEKTKQTLLTIKWYSYPQMKKWLKIGSIYQNLDFYPPILMNICNFLKSHGICKLKPQLWVVIKPWWVHSVLQCPKSKKPQFGQFIKMTFIWLSFELWKRKKMLKI